MRSSTQLIIGALAVVATSGLVGQGLPASAAEPTTTRERGLVIECTGTIKGRPVYTSLYENDTVRNTIQILIGDDGHQVGGSRDTDRDFRDGRQVRGTLKVAGRRALVEGTARKVGERVPVHEEHDDAGQHITIDGFHRRLATDLRLTWKGASAPLTCDNAFVYDLQVTKEPTV
ncbi:hypothetical protein [Nocardioides sp. T2.26MG-1]|uniref:hypothetical protein n=1 Tax=Nocardioides sp. T2.26MG-1 TaxID=3041166 RepID=UPI0024774487|nr:hypothetical protein [Nocardioides sp. T2.26MG-1]CAI9414248.1 hypothetical protein HIDPHFAB_02222 [Nocardioides sp. T2.26MG-1]